MSLLKLLFNIFIGVHKAHAPLTKFIKAAIKKNIIKHTNTLLVAVKK